jgi:hypothetical protein
VGDLQITLGHTHHTPSALSLDLNIAAAYHFSPVSISDPLANRINF